MFRNYSALKAQIADFGVNLLAGKAASRLALANEIAGSNARALGEAFGGAFGSSASDLYCGR